ncbi:hypothetical protein ANN_18416 [Periplaneta americana]|uniref:Uncharacterized protein n=1 Tax=Periplaneta americana TaxID=6978 RepID=A0ABQ8SQ16_PERAM|nr:hypothetical protein ANN_18416 [Periplaneta americana]
MRRRAQISTVQTLADNRERFTFETLRMYLEVVVITEDVQNVHLLLECRPHIDVSLTCEHDPKLQEYCVCPQNMPQFDSEGILNQAPETNKPMILNGPTSRNREGSDQQEELMSSRPFGNFEGKLCSLTDSESNHRSICIAQEAVSFPKTSAFGPAANRSAFFTSKALVFQIRRIGYISVVGVPEFCPADVLLHASKSTDMSLSHLNTLNWHRPGPGSNLQPRAQKTSSIPTKLPRPTRSTPPLANRLLLPLTEPYGTRQVDQRKCIQARDITIFVVDQALDAERAILRPERLNHGENLLPHRELNSQPSALQCNVLTVDASELYSQRM